MTHQTDRSATGALPLAFAACAGGADRDRPLQCEAALGHVLDLDLRRFGTDVAGVREIALLAAEEVEHKVSDRRVRDNRDGRLQAALAAQEHRSEEDTCELQS